MVKVKTTSELQIHYCWNFFWIRCLKVNRLFQIMNHMMEPNMWQKDTGLLFGQRVIPLTCES